MLSNKNIIVSGSSSGIGLSITKALLKNKANVLGVSRRNPNFSNKNYHHIEFDLSKIVNTKVFMVMNRVKFIFTVLITNNCN